MMNGGFQSASLTKRKVVTLTNAQVLSMFSAPTLIIPAPPAGSLIQVVSWLIENINGGTAYTGGGAIALFYGSTSPPTIQATPSIAATNLTTPTTTVIIKGVGGGVAQQSAAAMVGAGVYIGNQTANFAQVGNTGTLRVEVLYTISGGW